MLDQLQGESKDAYNESNDLIGQAKAYRTIIGYLSRINPG